MATTALLHRRTEFLFFVVAFEERHTNVPPKAIGVHRYFGSHCRDYNLFTYLLFYYMHVTSADDDVVDVTKKKKQKPITVKISSSAAAAAIKQQDNGIKEKNGKK